jgi:hypothetical protein
MFSRFPGIAMASFRSGGSCRRLLRYNTTAKDYKTNILFNQGVY